MADTQPRPAPAIDWSAWERPLQHFSNASGMVISAIDADGVRQAGPYAGGPLGTLLSQSALFADDGAGTATERAGLAMLQSGRPFAELFEGMLRVHALPVVQHDAVVGSVTFGWVLADFPSSLACDRLADISSLPRTDLWRLARLEGPVSATRMATNGALLETMVSWGSQLVEAKAGLEQLSLARDAFLARVSHELRTPLNAIALRANLIERVAEDSDAVRVHVEALRRSVDVETSLVEDLLEAAVTRTGSFTLAQSPCDLADVVRGSCEQVAPSADARQVTIALDVPPAPVRIIGDPGRLRQAVWNVVANAVKFSPVNGRVDVTLVTTSSAHVVRVADQGPGIAPELARQIFEPFVRSERANDEGLGLGLAIARQIVELHGGRLYAQTDGQRRGACFVLELPLRAEIDPPRR